MAVKEIQYKTVLSNFQKGEKPCYRAVVISNGSKDIEDVIKAAAERSGLDNDTIRYCWNIMVAELKNATEDGKTINARNFFGTSITVHGVFDAANSPWEPGKHSLNINITPKGELKNVLANAVGVNVTKGNRCRITSVMDAELHTEGVISCGENVEVFAAGGNFFVDTSAEDEGCWIEDMEGQVVAFGTVTASTATTLDVTFAATPEPGNYKFVVATRGGLGPEYGVSIARRNIEIR